MLSTARCLLFVKDYWCFCVWICSAQQCRSEHVSAGQSFSSLSHSGLLSHKQLLVCCFVTRAALKQPQALYCDFTFYSPQHNYSQAGAAKSQQKKTKNIRTLKSLKPDDACFWNGEMWGDVANHSQSL